MKNSIFKKAELAPKFTLVNKSGQFVKSIEDGFTDNIEDAIRFSIGFDNQQIKTVYYSAALHTEVIAKYI